MKSKPIVRQSFHLTQFDIMPLAGVFLAINCLLLLVYFPRGPRCGLSSLEATPQYCSACFNVPSDASVVVGLGRNGRTSFTTFDATLQLATLKSVSQQYGIGFPVIDINRLEKLPFLAVNFEQLPSFLTSTYASTTSLHLEDYPGLTDEQLVSCIQAARKLAPTGSQYTADVSLLIDARTNASKVMRLLHMLQNQGIGRFNLITHCQ